YIREMRQELQRVDELLAGVAPALDAEGHHAGRPGLAIDGTQVLASEGVVRTRTQSWPVDPRAARMLEQDLRDSPCVLAVPFHAQMQGFNSLQQQEGRQRCQ